MRAGSRFNAMSLAKPQGHLLDRRSFLWASYIELIIRKPTSFRHASYWRHAFDNYIITAIIRAAYIISTQAVMAVAGISCRATNSRNVGPIVYLLMAAVVDANIIYSCEFTAVKPSFLFTSRLLPVLLGTRRANAHDDLHSNQLGQYRNEMEEAMNTRDSFFITHHNNVPIIFHTFKHRFHYFISKYEI